MKNVKQLTEERGTLIESLNQMVDGAKSEARELTNEEATQFDTMTTQVEALDNQLSRAHKAEAMKAEAAKNNTPLNKEEETAKRSWSLFKAVDGMLNGNLTGLEAEIQEEAQKEARGSLSGIGIPTWMHEKRAYVDQATSAVAPVAVEAYADALTADTIYDKVGLNDLGNLAADTIVPITAATATAWAAENAAGSDLSANFGKITLQPKRVNGFSNVSRVLLVQNPGAEAAVMRELGRGVGRAIDDAMFSTVSVGSAPTSIAATTGVLTFTESTTAGGAGFVEDLITAEQTLADSSGLHGTEKYVCQWAFLTASKTQAQVSNVSPVYYREDGKSFLNGHEVFYSSHPATAGGPPITSADNLFGDFSRVYFASFGPLDIVVDPYSEATNNAVRLVLNHHYDFAVASGASFVKFTSLL